LRHKVTEALALQETRIRIALHRLEDVVFGVIKKLWVSTLLRSLNGFLNIRQDALGNNDLSLRSRKEVRIQDLFGRCAQVLSPWL
jgi:ketopantoate reductase